MVERVVNEERSFEMQRHFKKSRTRMETRSSKIYPALQGVDGEFASTDPQ